MDITEMKKRLARGREARGRYAKALREAVVAYAGEQRKRGLARDKVAEELGMSVATLGYWCTPPKRKTALTAVTVVSEHRAPDSELVLECGPLRIRGLDLAGVAELMRRLA